MTHIFVSDGSERSLLPEICARGRREDARAYEGRRSVQDARECRIVAHDAGLAIAAGLIGLALTLLPSARAPGSPESASWSGRRLLGLPCVLEMRRPCPKSHAQSHVEWLILPSDNSD